MSFYIYVYLEDHKLGRQPIALELFLYTHTQKGDGKTFVDKKSKAVNVS